MNTNNFTRPGKDNSSPGFFITREFRRLLMYICTFKYAAADVDCRFCTAYIHRRCAAADGCPFIAERIEAGAVDYGEVIRDTFKRPPAILRWRLRYLIEHFGDSMWESEKHEQRFHRIWAELGTRKKRDTPRFFAALYLLTANDDIWHRAYNLYSIEGIETNYIRLHGISVPNYALVQAAKSLYNDTDHFTLEDLEDCEAVNTGTFRLVVNAILIARYGRDVLKIRRDKCLL